MMGLPSISRGPLKAIMLAGVVLGCMMQLVQAQSRFFVTKEPEHPKVGQEVTLIPRGIPGQVNLCQWFRDSTSGRSGEILSYTPFLKQSNQKPQQDLDKNYQNSNGSAYTGRETLYRNCSLRIQKLTAQDTGNYTIVLETVASQSGQEGQSDVQALEAVIYLQIEAAAQRINVNADVQFPKPGQSITLTPQVNLRQITFCQWSIQSRSGHSKPILRQIPGQQVEQVDSDYRGRTTLRDACALTLTQLRTSDTNNYTVTIRAPVQQHGQPQQPQNPQQPQRPQQPGQWDHNQEEHDREYTGHVYLNIAEKHTGTKGGSASLSYSAGIIAGGLFGSLAWADSLMSLFSALFGSFASWRPKLFL